MDSLELVKQLVSIPSVNPFKYYFRDNSPEVIGIGAEQEINLFIEQYLIDAGFEVMRQYLNKDEKISYNGEWIDIPARWNLLGVRYPKNNWNGRSLLFFGHTDTVDVKNGWDSDPFSITIKKTIKGERWFGLGSNDMKGGLAAILDSIKNTYANNHAVKVAFLVDEEYYSLGADLLSRSDFLNDVVIALAPEIGDLVCNSTFNNLDDQLIGIGRVGREEYEFNIIGKACHGSDVFISNGAINAVHESAKLQVELLRDFKEQYRVFLKNGAQIVNSIFISWHNGGAAILSVPDKAEFVLDRSFLPDESPDNELKRLRHFISTKQSSGVIDANAKILVSPRQRPTPSCRPYICSTETEDFQRVLSSVKLHKSAYSYYIGRSVADENRIAARGIPTYTIGPSGAGSHTAEEWVDPISITQVTQIFKSFITSS